MSSEFLNKVDSLIEEKSLLKHPFYKMWSNGELTVEQLAGYSQEYFALVKAVPEFVTAIEASSPRSKLRSAIAENLAEEQSHIGLWMRFATSLGIPEAALNDFEPSNKTIKAVSELRRLSKLSFDEAICAMYAYESSLPKISKTKREGLKKFYGLDSEDATTYFDIHEKVDVRHAAVWRSFMKSIPKDKREAALRAVVKSMLAQNKLLDSVMDRYVKQE